MNDLTHLDEQGRARMVDVSQKPLTARRATATGILRCQAETVAVVLENRAPKGAVITTAELAGIMAAKRTSDLIPLCHPLPISQVSVKVTPAPDLPGFRIEAEVATTAQTGVEMEALTAASVCALTLYDMLKAVDKAMAIETLAVARKSGGQSGAWPDKTLTA